MVFINMFKNKQLKCRWQSLGSHDYRHIGNQNKS